MEVTFAEFRGVVRNQRAKPVMTRSNGKALFLEFSTEKGSSLPVKLPELTTGSRGLDKCT